MSPELPKEHAAYVAAEGCYRKSDEGKIRRLAITGFTVGGPDYEPGWSLRVADVGSSLDTAFTILEVLDVASMASRGAAAGLARPALKFYGSATGQAGNYVRDLTIEEGLDLSLHSVYKKTTGTMVCGGMQMGLFPWFNYAWEECACTGYKMRWVARTDKDDPRNGGVSRARRGPAMGTGEKVNGPPEKPRGYRWLADLERNLSCDSRAFKSQLIEELHWRVESEFP